MVRLHQDYFNELKKLTIAYNNSLRRSMNLPWRNSASEMFVNLNIWWNAENIYVWIYVKS